MRALLAVILLAGCGASEPPSQAPPSQDPSVPFPAWQLPESAREAPPAPLPTTFAELQQMDEGGSRCPERLRTRLAILDGDTRTGSYSLDGAFALPGAIDVPTGRHKGQRGLPLDAVLGEHATLEVWPCRGDMRAFSREELTPSRYVFVRSGKDTLKLIDLTQSSPAPLMKNVAGLRRVD